MRPNRTSVFVAVLLAVIGSTAVARADEAAAPASPTLKPLSAFPWFVGIGGGVGYATISHPQIVPGSSAVSMLNLYGGYTFGEHLTVGVDVASSETSVGRDAATEPFKIGYSPQAIWEIPTCSPCEPRPHGNDVKSTSLVFTSLAGRAEYAPFGRDGLFVGGMAGAAFLVGLDGDPGFSFGGRVGYRYRATNVLTLSIEAGMTGQLYKDATMYMPFGLVVVRPYFLSGVRPSQTKPKP